MSRTLAALPPGSRITDYLSLGVVAQRFPINHIREVLKQTGRASQRQRELPAQVVVYYVIALALYMQSSYREVLRCLLEGIQWLLDPSVRVTVAGKSGISQARTRLGAEPLRHLHDRLVGPMAVPSTRGAWYRNWRVVSLDGSTLDVADEANNARAFGRPSGSRGQKAYPQVRFVSLLENGTHVLFGSRLGPITRGELPLAQEVVSHLKAGMLCLADRFFLRVSVLAAGRGDGSGVGVAREKESPPALRTAPFRRLLPESDLPLAEGFWPSHPGRPRAHHRIPVGGGGRRPTPLSLDHHLVGSGPGPGGGTGGALRGALGNGNRPG